MARQQLPPPASRTKGRLIRYKFAFSVACARI